MCLVIKMCHTRMTLNGQWRKKETLPPVCLRLSTSSVRLLPPSCWGFKKGERSSLLLALTAGRMKPSFVSQVSCIGSVMIWTCLDVQSLRSYYLSIFHWRRPSSNRHDACSMMMQLAANPSDLSKMMRISGLTRRQINHFAHYLPRQAGVGLLLTSCSLLY